jgi:hypothetical protein
MNINDIITESQQKCPHCGGPLMEYSDLMEKKDACYYKVKASAKVWPSAYASGRLVQCRKKGAGNYGNKSESVAEGSTTRGGFGGSAGQAQHEIEWLKKKISSLPPTKEKQIRDLQRQIRERELAIAFQKEAVAEDKGMTQYNAFKREWRAKHGSDAKVPGYDSKEYNAYWWRQGDKQQGVAEGWFSSSNSPNQTLLDLGLKDQKLQDILNREDIYSVDLESLKDFLIPFLEGDRFITDVDGFAYDLTRDAVPFIDRIGETDDVEYIFKRLGQRINVAIKNHRLKNQTIEEQQLDEKCWDGYQQQGMKNKSGRQVPNCVPVTEELTTEQQFDMIEDMVEHLAETHGVDPDEIWEDFESVDDHELFETAAWRRKEGKSAKGGLNAKGVASYRRENPGSKLQTAVTTKPSKLKPGSKAAKRRKSFCARMGGVKGPMKKPNGKPTRKALALRKWNC